MGFFKNLVNNVTPTLTNAISKSAKEAANNLIYGEVGGTGRVQFDKSFLFGDTPNEEISKFDSKKYPMFANPKENKLEDSYDRSNGFADNTNVRMSSTNEGSLETLVGIPRWGYKDFINERVSWQKSLDSLTGEPGWFYFKIFFKFDTNYGLFPGILADGGTIMLSENSAMNYLSTIHNRYSKVQSTNRKVALRKFGKTLSWINTYAPWFFKKISGMDNASYLDLNEIGKERFIEIECSEDAVDMRLSTLMDLYRYVCYDPLYQREILPENLRKFDMDVVIFHTPLRYYHTAGKSLAKGSFPYKSLHADDMGDRMSFRMVTFSGCEFDLASMTAIPNELNNEKAFNMGSNKIKIKYNKAITTDLNEWFKFMFTDAGGFMWDAGQDMMWEAKYLDRKNDWDEVASAKEKKDSFNSITGSQQKRIDAIKYAIDHRFFYNPKSTNYKSLIDASEDVITNAMRMIKPSEAFGNMYAGFTDPNGDYYKEKIAYENGERFRTVKHGDVSHRVIPGYEDQKPENQHRHQPIDFNSLHKADISDANNPMSPYYQRNLRTIYNRPSRRDQLLEKIKQQESIKDRFKKPRIATNNPLDRTIVKKEPITPVVPKPKPKIKEFNKILLENINSIERF